MINTEIAPPVAPSIIFRSMALIVSEPNVVSIVASRVSTDTTAAAKLIAFEAEKAGLLNFLYFMTLIIANVSVVNVYDAIAMAVIIWC